MLHYLLLGKTVVFDSVSAETRWLVQRDETKEVTIERFYVRDGMVPAMVDPNTIYLFDPSAAAKEPLLCQAFTIICSPPNRAHYKQTLNRVGQLRVTPVWNLKELKAMGAQLGRHAAEVEERYGIVGGTARTVFGPRSVKELRNEIKKLIADALEYPGHLRADDTSTLAIISKASFKLLAMEPEDEREFKRSYARHALSPFIAERYEAAAAKMDELELERWSNMANGSIAGVFFEPFVRGAPKGEQELVVRRLRAEVGPRAEWDECTWHLQCEPRAIGVEEIEWHEQGLRWPARKNFPAIDAHYRGTLGAEESRGKEETVLIQTTVSVQHNVNIAVREHLLNAAGAEEDPKPKLLFLTRKDEYDAMTIQRIKERGRNVSKKVEDEVNALMEQWVGYVPPLDSKKRTLRATARPTAGGGALAAAPSDEEPPAEPAPPAKKVKKAADSDSDSSGSDSSDEEAPAAPAPPAKKAKTADSDSDSSDSDSSDDEAAAPAPAAGASAGSDSDSSDSSDSDSSDSDDDEEEKEQPERKRKASDSSPPAKKVAKVGEAGVAVALTGEPAYGCEIFVGGLPWSAGEAEVREFFEACGTISKINLPVRPDGRSSGNAYVTFATSEAANAAVEMNGQELGGRWLKIDLARQRKPRGEKPEGCTTVFCGNLSWDIDENAMYEFFADCGTVTRVRFAMDRDTGDFRGFGHVDFDENEPDAVDKAVAKAGEYVMGRAIRVDYAAPRAPASAAAAATGAAVATGAAAATGAGAATGAAAAVAVAAAAAAAATGAGNSPAPERRGE